MRKEHIESYTKIHTLAGNASITVSELASSPEGKVPFADAYGGAVRDEEQTGLIDQTSSETLERTGSKTRPPKKTGKESPFLNALGASMLLPVFIAENEQLRVKNEELVEQVERRRQQNRESKRRQREADPEAYRAYQREYMREYYRAKKQQNPPSAAED